MRTGQDWYKGTADAIYQNLNIITDEEPDYIFVFGADHVYRMDVRQMLDFHIAAARPTARWRRFPVPIEEGQRVRHHRRRAGRARCCDFLEKPKNPPPMPGNPRCAWPRWATTSSPPRRWCRRSSATRRTRRARTTSASRSSARCTSARRVFVYDFAAEPGAGPGARRSAATGATWGTSTSTTSATWTWWRWTPIFNLYNDRWPIYTATAQLPAGQVRLRRRGEQAAWATPPTRWCAEGCIISGGHVHRSRPLAQGARQLVLRRERLHPLRERHRSAGAAASAAPSSTRTWRSPRG